MEVLCPKDGQIMHPIDYDRSSYQCFICHYILSKPQDKEQKRQNNRVGSLHKYTSLVFIIALSSVFLMSIQMGGLSSYADIQTVEKSVKLSALIIWWIIFMLLFTIPVSIYYQMAIKKKATIYAIKTPLAIGIPITVILLELINIILIFPIISL